MKKLLQLKRKALNLESQHLLREIDLDKLKRQLKSEYGTLSQASFELNIPNSTLSHFLNGRQGLSIKHLRKLHEVYEERSSDNLP